MCVDLEGVQRMKKDRLFTLYYYLHRHIIYMLLKKDYLHFKVKASMIIMVSQTGILTSLRFYGVVAGDSHKDSFCKCWLQTHKHTKT